MALSPLLARLRIVLTATATARFACTRNRARLLLKERAVLSFDVVQVHRVQLQVLRIDTHVLLSVALSLYLVLDLHFVDCLTCLLGESLLELGGFLGAAIDVEVAFHVFNRRLLDDQRSLHPDMRRTHYLSVRIHELEAHLLQAF